MATTTGPASARRASMPHSASNTDCWRDSGRSVATRSAASRSSGRPRTTPRPGSRSAAPFAEQVLGLASKGDPSSELGLVGRGAEPLAQQLAQRPVVQTLRHRRRSGPRATSRRGRWGRPIGTGAAAPPAGGSCRRQRRRRSAGHRRARTATPSTLSKPTASSCSTADDVDHDTVDAADLAGPRVQALHLAGRDRFRRALECNRSHLAP